jgi:hypothetical protein
VQRYAVVKVFTNAISLTLSNYEHTNVYMYVHACCYTNNTQSILKSSSGASSGAMSAKLGCSSAAGGSGSSNRGVSQVVGASTTAHTSTANKV